MPRSSPRSATASQAAQNTQATAQAVLTAVSNQRQSVSGVSLDEEMTNLIQFQQAYQASARVMNAIDSALSTLISSVGRGDVDHDRTHHPPDDHAAQVLANINDVQDQLATTQQELSTGSASTSRPTIPTAPASPSRSTRSRRAKQLHQQRHRRHRVDDGRDDVADEHPEHAPACPGARRAGLQRHRVRRRLAASAAEINQLIDAIKQEANTQYNGQYIFSGTATNTAPYSTATGDVYQGNSGAVTRQIGPNSSLQVNADISSLLGSGQGPTTASCSTRCARSPPT